MDRAANFAAAQYDREIMRVAADHSWETPVRTAGRLVLTGIDHTRLRAYGLTSTLVTKSRGLLEVWLQIDDDYQVFVEIPWQDQSPEEVADEARAILARPPAEWPARWHAIEYSLRTTPPEIVGSHWKVASLPG